MRSVGVRTPNRVMSSRRYVSTGFGPTSSAVGMFEPVTITRSAVASAAPALGAMFVPVVAGGGGGAVWARALVAMINGNTTATARATRIPNVFCTFLVIGFSMVWLGLARDY